MEADDVPKSEMETFKLEKVYLFIDNVYLCIYTIAIQPCYFVQ